MKEKITIIASLCLIMANMTFGAIETYKKHPPTGDCKPKSYTGIHKIYTPRPWPLPDKVYKRDTWNGSVGEGGYTTWVLEKLNYSGYTIPKASGTMHGVRTPWDFTKLIMDYTIKVIKIIPRTL